MKETLIFNGTGINYSWHLPRLFDIPFDEFTARSPMYFLSGGSTALMVYWAFKKNLATWGRKELLNWNRLTHAAYGNNLLSGTKRFLKLALKSKSPIYTAEDYKRAWSIAVRPEFFEVKMKDLPKNVFVPLLERASNEIVIASADSKFADMPAYLVSFAATAIPNVFPDISLGSSTYGDITYSRKFLPWLKAMEQKAPYFENYNLLKNAEFSNGKYIKICDHPNPKKMMQSENMKFLFGRYLKTYPENILRSKI